MRRVEVGRAVQARAVAKDVAAAAAVFARKMAKRAARAQRKVEAQARIKAIERAKKAREEALEQARLDRIAASNLKRRKQKAKEEGVKWTPQVQRKYEIRQEMQFIRHGKRPGDTERLQEELKQLHVREVALQRAEERAKAAGVSYVPPTEAMLQQELAQQASFLKTMENEYDAKNDELRECRDDVRGGNKDRLPEMRKLKAEAAAILARLSNQRRAEGWDDSDSGTSSDEPETRQRQGWRDDDRSKDGSYSYSDEEDSDDGAMRARMAKYAGRSSGRFG